MVYNVIFVQCECVWNGWCWDQFFLAFCWVGNNTPLWSFHICTATVLTLTYVDMVEVYCASFVVVIQAQRVRVWLGIEVLLYENYLYCNNSRLLRGFFRSSYTHACCCIQVYMCLEAYRRRELKQDQHRPLHVTCFRSSIKLLRSLKCNSMQIFHFELYQSSYLSKQVQHYHNRMKGTYTIFLIVRHGTQEKNATKKSETFSRQPTKQATYVGTWL